MIIFVNRMNKPAFTLLGLIFIQRDQYNIELLNHEMIHRRQQLETLFLAYPFYMIEFLCKLAYYRSAKKAYLSVSFEREAYFFQIMVGYLGHRKPFSFLKYVFYKKKKMLTVNYDSSEDVFTELFSKPAGTVFKYTDKPESLIKRAGELFTENFGSEGVFRIRHINAGTDLYTVYGPNHAIIAENSNYSA